MRMRWKKSESANNYLYHHITLSTSKDKRVTHFSKNSLIHLIILWVFVLLLGASCVLIKTRLKTYQKIFCSFLQKAWLFLLYNHKISFMKLCLLNLLVQANDSQLTCSHEGSSCLNCTLSSDLRKQNKTKQEKQCKKNGLLFLWERDSSW